MVNIISRRSNASLVMADQGVAQIRHAHLRAPNPGGQFLRKIGSGGGHVCLLSRRREMVCDLAVGLVGRRRGTPFRDFRSKDRQVDGEVHASVRSRRLDPEPRKEPAEIRVAVFALPAIGEPAHDLDVPDPAYPREKASIRASISRSRLIAASVCRRLPEGEPEAGRRRELASRS